VALERTYVFSFKVESIKTILSGNCGLERIFFFSGGGGSGESNVDLSLWKLTWKRNHYTF